jgi:carboxymethylenebutenolidase
MRKSSSYPTLLTLLSVIALFVACGGSGDGDYADRMAREHAEDRPVASGATDAEPAGRIDEETVVYATMDGQSVEGFLAKPASATEGAPGLIVIQEWWGLNDNIRAVTRRLAGEGYIALAVDLYGGQVADDPARARELMMAAMENKAGLEENLRHAAGYLRENLGASKLGTIGWCFGGGWSLQTALLLPGQIDASVIYYGRVESDRQRLATLQTPILGIFGSEDQGIPVDGVREFESALEELSKDAEIRIYEGADHAFANPSGTRYNAEAAEDAWSRTLEFLRERLVAGAS